MTKPKSQSALRSLALFSLGAVLALSGIVGCSKKTSAVSDVATTPEESTTANTHAGVAIIDVNQIAVDCGALSEINVELDKREADFNLILEGLREIHLKDLVKMEKEFGDEPSEQQTRQLAELRNKQAAEYNVKWQNTRIKLSTIKQKLDEAFLTKLRPIATSVAKEKGLSVVLRNENVFCLVDQFDITGDVTSAFQMKYPPKQVTPVVKVAEIPSRGGEFEPRK